jgi:hypothetical protein
MKKYYLKLKCFIFGHQYKIVDRVNGSDWGWYKLKCKSCNKKSDTLIE